MASVEVLMDAAWECYVSMHLLLTPCSRLRAEHSASNMGLREVYALRASLFCYEVCTFAILYLLTAFFHVLQSSEQV
jgi:hypothetical protein